MKIYLSPTRRLTILYLVALSTIGLLSVVGNLLVDKVISNLAHDSRIINIAGRQRMLSQKLTKAALAFYLETNLKMRQQRIKEIQEALHLWSSSHEALQFGNLELGLSNINSETVTKMFAEIEPHHQIMVESTEKLLAIAIADDLEHNEKYLPLIKIILQHEDSFLKGMNQIVFQYDKESLEKVNNIKSLEFYLLIVTIIILVLQGVFTFHPAIISINNYIQEIQQAKNESHNLAIQLSEANENIKNLNQELEEDNFRLNSELNIVRKMQNLILPKSEELNVIEGLDIVGFMNPANEVGGDYYDVLYLDGIVTIGIGDVTGHGLESGILMIMTQAAVRTLKEIRERDSVKFLTTINQTIYKNVQRMESEKNLTLTILNYCEGTLTISGQHEEVIIVRNGGIIERIDTINLGFPIGLDNKIDNFIDTMVVTLKPGDGFVLYTDGITEAKNINKDQYGVERLCKLISVNWQYSASKIQEKVINDLMKYIGQQKVFDDLSLLVLKVEI